MLRLENVIGAVYAVGWSTEKAEKYQLAAVCVFAVPDSSNKGAL